MQGHAAVAFPTQICRRLTGKLRIEPTIGPPRDQELVMSTEHQPHHEQTRVIPYRGIVRTDNVVSLHGDSYARQADDAPDLDEGLLAALSPLLDEVDGLRKNQAQVRDASNVGLLLEENTRLRQLAVKLSNLLGDLPKQSA
jgi:hypothetical protein